MTRIIAHAREMLPGMPRVEWINATGEVLRLRPPNSDQTFDLCADGWLQIPAGELARSPRIDAWLEGLELGAKLIRCKSKV